MSEVDTTSTTSAQTSERNVFDDPIREEQLRPSVIDCSGPLASLLGAFFKDAQTADCTFVVGSGDNTERIPAHRFVVSSWSAPLRRMLWGSFAEAKSCEVLLPDKDPAVFSQFLSYLYTAKMEIDEVGQREILPSLLAIAHEFDVQPLVEALLQQMGDNVNEDTVCLLMALATRYDQKELQEKFQKWISTNGQLVMCGRGILDLPLELFSDLVQSDLLAAHEVDIFRAIGRWCHYDPDAIVSSTATATTTPTHDTKTDAPVTSSGSVSANDTKTEAKGAEQKEEKKASTSSSAASSIIYSSSSTRMQHLPILAKHARFAQMKLRDIFGVVKPSGLLAKDTIMELVDMLADPDTADAKKWNMTRREPPAVQRAATTRFEDNAGIIYWIGTDSGRSLSYSNPHPDHVTVTMSSSAGSPLPSVFDRNIRESPVENSYGSEPNPWIAVEFKEHRVQLESVYIAQEADHYLRNWRIEGSDDGRTWVALANFANNATITEEHRFGYFAITSDKFYRRVRIYVTGHSTNDQSNFDITQLEFFGKVSPLGAHNDNSDVILTRTPQSSGVIARAWYELPVEPTPVAAPPPPVSLGSSSSSSKKPARARSRSPVRATRPTPPVVAPATVTAAEDDDADMGFSLFD